VARPISDWPPGCDRSRALPKAGLRLRVGRRLCRSCDPEATTRAFASIGSTYHLADEAAMARQPRGWPRRRCAAPPRHHCRADGQAGRRRRDAVRRLVAALYETHLERMSTTMLGREERRGPCFATLNALMLDRGTRCSLPTPMSMRTPAAEAVGRHCAHGRRCRRCAALACRPRWPSCRTPATARPNAPRHAKGAPVRATCSWRAYPEIECDGELRRRLRRSSVAIRRAALEARHPRAAPPTCAGLPEPGRGQHPVQRAQDHGASQWRDGRADLCWAQPGRRTS
jgi:hypothetical protein